MTEFVPERASADEWRRYHVFRRRQQEEYTPYEPLHPDPVEEARLKLPRAFETERRWQVTLGDEMVSVLEARAVRSESPEYDTNKHLLEAFAYVLAGHRRSGLGRAWVPVVVDMMNEHGATVLSSSAKDEAGHAFLRALGAEPKLVERESWLDLGAVDWDMVARWVAEGQARSPESRLELYPDRPPDNLLPELSTVLTELFNTIPTEDMDHGDWVVTPERKQEWMRHLDVSGGRLHTMLVREPDGSVAGLTQVAWEPTDMIHQELTAVHPRARGRGLGKWLKAAMLEHVHREHPDAPRIVTENAGSNAPMLAINVALGFRPHLEETYYQVSRDRLAESVPAAT